MCSTFGAPTCGGLRRFLEARDPEALLQAGFLVLVAPLRWLQSAWRFKKGRVLGFELEVDMRSGTGMWRAFSSLVIGLDGATQ